MILTSSAAPRLTLISCTETDEGFPVVSGAKRTWYNIEHGLSFVAQRTVLPELLRSLPEGMSIAVTTQSPVVLMSMSALFDPKVDTFLVARKGEKGVELVPQRWYRYGDIAAWTDAVCGFTQDVEAEQALDHARAFLRRREGDQTREDYQKISAELSAVLSSTDRFWGRWVGLGDDREWTP